MNATFIFYQTYFYDKMDKNKNNDSLFNQNTYPSLG